MKAMTTSEIVGDLVQIFLRDAGELRDIGIDQRISFMKVAGMDEFGIWVEHPNYIIKKINDPTGKPLPADQQERKQIAANFLVRWELINSIIHFPDREGYDYPNPYDVHIGFVNPDEDDA